MSKTFTLDFAGRKVVDEQLTVDLKDYADQIEEILTEKKNVTSQKNIILNQNFRDLAPKVLV